MPASSEMKMYLELPGLTAAAPRRVFDKQHAGHKSSDGQTSIAFINLRKTVLTLLNFGEAKTFEMTC